MNKKYLFLLVGMFLLIGFLGNIGATITTDGTITYQDIGGVNYTTITFLSNGYFNTTNLINMSILVVGGGGGGGSSTQGGGGGGGGAGGIIYNNSALVNGNYTINIGAGGTGVASDSGTNGKISYFGNNIFNMTAFGGGYGSRIAGGSGGSGGGASEGSGGGSTTQSSVNGTGYGNNGGAGGYCPNTCSGGGGGSGTIGTAADIGDNNLPGNGGNGLTFTIYNGTALYYAGGAGGGSYNVGGGTGGLGGGATGTVSGTGNAGIANKGGGGGGTGFNGVGGAGGSGIVIVRYTIIPDFTSILVNLTSPTNNSVFSTATQTFNAIQTFNISLNITGTNYGYSWVNNTYYIWFKNGTLFNTTYSNGLGTNSTSVSKSINNFVVGNYLWNSYACYSNTTYSNCSWATNNYSFSRGSTINSLTYNNNTFETSLEQFIINLSLAEGAQVSLVQLIYNGTTYVFSNITISGNNYIAEKKINIPLNINSSANQTNDFYFKFTYDGNSIQTLATYQQNSSFIKLIQCGGSYTIQALNFTFYDEYNLNNINAVNNKTTLYSSFKYWLGDGSVYKNYSFQNLSSTYNNYTFCIYPYASNITFKTDLDMGFYADSYREGTYYLRNATLTNISNDILLYLVPQDYATKFFLTFENGVDAIRMGTVNVQEYFVGLGMYQTVAILLTDMEGKATMWQEIDKTYRYSIVQDNRLLGIVDRVSICSATPCSLTIQITQPIGSAFEAYDEYYAKNVLSNISYDKTTHWVNYTFIDTTGLANYFRFEVKQSKVDGTGATICNLFSYSSAGTLSCNLTNLTGDFLATGYISRSPEKVNIFLSFVIDVDVLENLGTTGVFIVMILIITIVIGGAVISRGNPTTILFCLGVAILGTKLIGLLFFSWTIVVVLEVLIFWMIFQMKS